MSLARRQAGAALIVAMLIVALAATVAAAMLAQQSAAASRAQAVRDYDQARWVLRAGMQWARMILAQDARSGSFDHARELWASGLPVTQVEQATLSGSIMDAQGRFNINNLVRDDGTRSERDIAAFKRLLALVGLRPELAEAAADWLDADSQPGGPAGAEDPHYAGLAAPYRAANQRVADLAELALVRGWDDAVLAALRPFVSALPRRTAVNVNFAPPEVLAALVAGLTIAEARELARLRAEQPFRDHAQFVSRLPSRELQAAEDDVSVRSQYFVVEGRARLGSADVRMHALMRRDGNAPATILWQRSS